MNHKLKTTTVLFALTASMLLDGCGSYETELEKSSKIETAQVVFEIVSESPYTVTRAVNENAVYDLNIYMASRATGNVVHFYGNSATPTYAVGYDTYDIWVIANAGMDLGEKTVEGIEGMVLDNIVNGDRIVMSGKTQYTVDKNKGPVQAIPAITVKRTVARLAYNISISGTIKDMQIISVEFGNVPAGSSLFGSGNSQSMTYRNLPLIQVSPFWSVSGVVYLNENLKGTNNQITTPEQKNRINAPSNATYMVVRAKSGDEVYSYVIYPGENTTNDFNIRRNSSTTMKITITGKNTLDWRIDKCYVEITTDSEFFIQPDKFYSFRKFVYVDSEGELNNFRASLKVMPRGQNRITINDLHTSELMIDITPGQECSFMVQHWYDLITPENEVVDYVLTVYDELGTVYREESSFKLRNFIILKSFITETFSRVSFSFSGAKYIQDYYYNDRAYILMAENAGRPVRLQATPKSGYTFTGWYTGDLRNPFSTSLIVEYNPVKWANEIYFQ